MCSFYDNTQPANLMNVNSDGFFELEELPQKSVIVGGGYIAIELAGTFAFLQICCITSLHL